MATPNVTSIPLDTLHNLLCVGFKDAYHANFLCGTPFQIPFKPDALLLALLKSNDHMNRAAEFEAAIDTGNYTTKCISNANGGCFIHTRYAVDGQHVSVFLGANVSFIQNKDGIVECYPDTHIIIAGLEEEDIENTVIFRPLIVEAKPADKDIPNTPLKAKNIDDFYMILCSAQHAMAACLAGDAIDPELSQHRMDCQSSGEAYDYFLSLLGRMTATEVIADYHRPVNEDEYAASPEEAPAIPEFLTRRYS